MPKPMILRLVGVALAVALAGTVARAQTVEEHPELEPLFAEAGTRGTMVVHRIDGDRLQVVGKARAEQPFPPSSTFKIPNTLIALQTEVVAGMDETFSYAGTPYLVRGKPFLSPACNAAVTLKVALQQSCIPVFQDIAGRVGVARYNEWLARLIYGAGEVTDQNLKDFWLTGGVRITALQQVGFLDRLSAGRLPIRPDRVEALAAALVVATSDRGVLHAKTGYVFTSDPEVGWFVGWITKDDAVTATFALNLDMTTPAHPAARREIALAILRRLDLY